VSSHKTQQEYPRVAVPLWLFNWYSEQQSRVEFNPLSVNDMIQKDLTILEREVGALDEPTFIVLPTDHEEVSRKVKDARGRESTVIEVVTNAYATQHPRGRGEFRHVKQVRVTARQFTSLQRVQLKWREAGLRLSISTILGGILAVNRILDIEGVLDRYVAYLQDGNLIVKPGLTFDDYNQTTALGHDEGVVPITNREASSPKGQAEYQ